MTGTIKWFNSLKRQGIITVTDNGVVTRYFLLQSKVFRSPEVIEEGQFVRFEAVAPPQRPGLLPIACAVEISKTPFVDESQGGL